MPTVNATPARGKLGGDGYTQAHRPDLRQAQRPSVHSQRQGAGIPALAGIGEEARDQLFRLAAGGWPREGRAGKVDGPVDFHPRQLDADSRVSYCLGMNTANNGWRLGSREHRCSAFPTVWAAINGCAGSANYWRYTVGGFGRREVEYACSACRAARDESDALAGAALQSHLRSKQDAAGVADYRTARAKWVGGRPQLVKS